MCNKHFNKPAKNQTLSRAFPEFMAKKRSRGQPTLSPDLPSNEFGIKQYEFNTRSLVVIKFIKLKLIVRLFYETVKYLGIYWIIPGVFPYRFLQRNLNQFDDSV